jgi:hypothetical protein
MVRLEVEGWVAKPCTIMTAKASGRKFARLDISAYTTDGAVKKYKQFFQALVFDEIEAAKLAGIPVMTKIKAVGSVAADAYQSRGGELKAALKIMNPQLWYNVNDAVEAATNNINSLPIDDLAAPIPESRLPSAPPLPEQAIPEGSDDCPF